MRNCIFVNAYHWTREGSDENGKLNYQQKIIIGTKKTPTVSENQYSNLRVESQDVNHPTCDSLTVNFLLNVILFKSLIFQGKTVKFKF